jgi:hypothetical protein
MMTTFWLFRRISRPALSRRRLDQRRVNRPYSSASGAIGLYEARKK